MPDVFMKTLLIATPFVHDGGVGLILGIVIAERIRRKYGCSRYLSRIISTPDIWPTDDEPLNKPDNT